MTGTGLVLLAAIKTLTVLGAECSFSGESSPVQAEVVERAHKILAAQNTRRAKWDRYLALMGQRESRLSLESVRYRVAAGRKVYSFTVYGRLFVDGRFVRDDEIEDVLALERIFRAFLAHSTWKNEALKVISAESMLLRGFEDKRFARLDDAITRIAAEFNAKRREGVHELKPRLFKSFVVELWYWREDPVSEDVLRAELARLVAAGMCKDGSFGGWHAALQSAHGADFAERVVARADDPQVFVPVKVWKEIGK